MRNRDLRPAPSVYAAVMTMRRRGHAVYRVGDDRHEIDGSIVPTSWLLDEAKNQARDKFISSTSDEAEKMNSARTAP